MNVLSLFDKWLDQQNIEPAEGKYLDKFAELSGITRIDGECDESLRGRIIEISKGLK